MKINKLNFLESIKKYLESQSLEKHSIFMLFYGILGLVWLGSLKSSYYKSLGKIYVFIACVFVLLMFFGVGLHLIQIVEQSKKKNGKKIGSSARKPKNTQTITAKRKNNHTSDYHTSDYRRNVKYSNGKKCIKQVKSINNKKHIKMR